MTDEAENKPFLRKHLSYEIAMLGCALRMLDGCAEGALRSMYYECFAVYARNLKGVLQNEDGNNYKARDFDKDFIPAKSQTDKDAIKLIVRLNTRVFHLAKRDRDKGPITLIGVTEMYRWLHKELSRFGQELPETYQAEWTAAAPVVQAAAVIITGSASASNHFSNTASFTGATALNVGPTTSLTSEDGVLTIKIE